MAQKVATARGRRGPSLLATLVALVLTGLATGCGQGDGESVSRVPSSDSSISTTTTAATAGSGPDELGDGVHQVDVVSVDPANDIVAVDGIQVLEGVEAVLAYLADTDGQQLEGPQIYLRNKVERIHDLPVDPTGEFAVIFADDCCEPRDLGWHGFSEAARSGFAGLRGENPPFEAEIRHGVVTSLVQIHIP